MPSMLGGSCVPGEGWQQFIGTGVLIAGSHFPADASYAKVPAGRMLELINDKGEKHEMIGPAEFIFCSKPGFNDNVKKIYSNFYSK